MKHLFNTLVLLMAVCFAQRLGAQSFTASLDSITDANCPNTSDGGIYITVGGLPPFAFSWSNGATTEDITGLAPGTYSVTVSNPGNPDIVLSDIEVLWANLLPAVAATGGDLTCTATSVQLGSVYTSFNTSILWTGPGGFTSTDSLPVVAEAGDYQLTVVDTVLGCANSATATVFLNDTAPGATATGGTLTCLVGSVQLTGSAGAADVTFSWSGPGGFASSEQNPTVDVLGIYELTTTDTLNGCASSATALVFGDIELPSLTAGPDVSITCANPAAQLSGFFDPNFTSASWSGPNGFTSTELEPAVTEPGEYVLSGTDLTSGCTASDTAIVSVNTAPPTVTVTGGGLSCTFTTAQLSGNYAPATAIFGWSGPGGFTSDIQNPVVTVAGDYVFTAIDTVNGCSASATAVVAGDFEVPAVSAGADILSNCSNPVANLAGVFDQSLASGQWNGPAGFQSPVANAAFGAAGEYVLTVIDLTSGCSATDAVAVAIDTDQPGASATGGNITCANATVTITADSPTPGVSYEWTATGGPFSTDQQVEVALPGDYAVIVTDPSNGCTSTATAPVADLSSPPFVSAGPDGVLNCFLSEAVLDGAGSQELNTTINWATADGHIVAFGNTLYPTVDAAGTYILTVLDTVSHCSATDTVAVIQNSPVAVSITSTQNVACHGGSNGSATATATGGTGSYYFGWSSGAQAATASGLVAGVWHLTVVDSDGCTAVAEVNIGQPGELFANASAQNASSPVALDGKAWAAPTGGTAPYLFAWQNGSSTDTAFNLPAAPVRVDVTDANGCTASGFGNVQHPACNFEVDIYQKDLPCHGTADGVAAITVDFGDLPATVLWSTGATTDTIKGLSGGVYTVVVVDAAGCGEGFSVRIAEPEKPLATGFVFIDNVGCPEFAEGGLTAMADGGTQAYQYNWSTGATTESIGGLSIGSYSVTLTDAHGCSAVASTAIVSADNTPPVIVVEEHLTVALDSSGNASVTYLDFDLGSYDEECSITSWSVSPATFDCSQLGEHEVTIIAADASDNQSTALSTILIVDKIAPSLTCPANLTVGQCHAVQTFEDPVVYDNCPGGSLAQLLGLPSGSAFPVGATVNSFKFTDPSGNEGSCSFTINVVGSGSLTAASFDATCHGQCNGSAFATITGGLPPHTFLWSNDSTGIKVKNLCPGTYTVTSTDADGCTLTASVTVTEPSQLTVSVASAQNPSCPNSNDGSINLLASGGTGVLNYSWSNGGSTFAQLNLTSGDYSATVSDENGCTATASATLTGVDVQPPVLVINPTVTVPINDQGQAVLNAAAFDIGSVDNCGIALFALVPPVFDCDSLGQRQVTVTATDFGGNSTSATATVVIVDKKDPVLQCNTTITVGFCQAAEVNYQQPIVFDNCPVNSALIQLTAGLPSGATFPVGTTTNSFSYTDPSGNSGSCSFDVVVKDLITIDTIATTNETCPGFCNGTVAFTFSGNNVPVTVVGNTAGLCPGTYSFVLTDAYGCSALQPVTISGPPPFVFDYDAFNEIDSLKNGSIITTVTGGTPPYTYQWTSNGVTLPFTGSSITGLVAGDYNVLVSDANGCLYFTPNITIFNLVATTEPAWARGLALAPNPATEAVFLSFYEKMDGKMTVRLFDAAGRLASVQQVATGEAVDVSMLAPGLWQVRIEQADGSAAVRKLVVAR